MLGQKPADGGAEQARDAPDRAEQARDPRALFERTQIARVRGPGVPGASALTASELRLLPMLSTHLTTAEIAAELFLSRHTIKSRMKSIYRKLNASTRREAVAQARDLGLLEG